MRAKGAETEPKRSGWVTLESQTRPWLAHGCPGIPMREPSDGELAAKRIRQHRSTYSRWGMAAPKGLVASTIR